MKRNSRNNTRRPPQNMQSQRYVDTVRAVFNVGQDNPAFNFESGDLLPGLQTSSTASRLIILEKVIFEMMPNNASDQVLAQVQTGQSVSTTGTASEPFRLASSINPTRFVLDLIKLSKYCPQVLNATTVGNFAAARIQFYTDAANLEVYGRITTVVRVLPQKSLVTPVGFFITYPDSTSLPQEETNAPHTE